MNKVLLVGSLPPPAHGQSIAFESAINALKNENCKYEIIESSFRGGSYLSSFLKIMRYIFLVPYYIIFFRPDRIYFLCSRTFIGSLRDLYLLLFCLLSKAQVLNHLHGSDFRDFLLTRGYLYRLVLLRIYKRIDRHAVLIDGMQEQLFEIAKPSNIFIINNFYQSNAYINQLVNKVPSDTGLNILYLSTIIPSKGVFELIESVIEVSKTINVELHVAGGFMGDQALSTEETKDKFNSYLLKNDFIKYHGVVGLDEKYKLLLDIDVVALPSYYASEAVPLCLIEAMRMGCCIITTNYKYLPELIKNEINGLIVDIKSVDDLVSKFKFIKGNYDFLREVMAKNILESSGRYSEEEYHKNIINFINGVS